MRSTGHAWSYKAWCSVVISCFLFFLTALIGAFRSLLFTQGFAPSTVRCRTSLLLLCFLIVGIHASGISIPLSLLMLLGWIVPVDVVRVNCLFDHVHVVTRVTINEFYFVQEWLVSGVVGKLWKGGGLGTGASNASIVLLNSVLHRSSSFSDVHLAAFTGNPVNYAILFSRVDSVFWSYEKQLDCFN